MAIARLKIAFLAPPSAWAPAVTLANTFSKMRGAPAMNVGRITARFSTSAVTSPSTALAKPIRIWTVSRTLPNECDSGSHRYCRSSSCSTPVASIARPS